MDVSATLASASQRYKTTEVEKQTPLSFDVGYLTATDIAPIDEAVISSDRAGFFARLSRDNAQLLFNEIFSLPTERVDDGIIAKLPPVVTPLPREKSLPKAKPETRWEKFAKTRGIQHKKRSRMIFDEQSQEYKPRFGYQRAKDDTSDWLIEVPDGADPMEDQYEKKANEKKERVVKNKKNQQKNLERAEKISKANGGGKVFKEKRKKELGAALRVTKTSTASLGKFDPKLKDEPKMKSLEKKNKFDPVVLGTEVEKKKVMGVLEKVTKNHEKGKLLNVKKAVNKLQMEAENKARDRKQKKSKK